MSKRREQSPAAPDPIANLERLIVDAHIERLAFNGADAVEVARQRQYVEGLAASIADRLRHEHATRSGQ